jgi:hypothetical protein
MRPPLVIWALRDPLPDPLEAAVVELVLVLVEARVTVPDVVREEETPDGVG